jgi:predicted RND superfamily exporter protein
VVNHKNFIFVIFLFAAILALLARPFVKVDYDMMDYLPSDTKSTVSLEKMNEEFKGGIPNARVMVKDVSVYKALQIKEKLKKVDGVIDVTWLDDSVDVDQPLEVYDQSLVNSFYKDKTAIYTVSIDEDKDVAAVNHIRKIIGDKNAMSGNAVDIATSTTSVTKEVGMIVLVVVPFALLVLILTTTSWVEPLLILGSIGVAIIINMGSNLIFGKISFVTNAAGGVLQLAVCLDYSVFLIHRYKEIRKDNLNRDVKENIFEALTMSTSSILSSGLTTVIGFAALCIMKFKIGPDLGLALSKGIAISLLTVFVLTPALIIQFNKALARTEHRSFMPSFSRFANGVTKRMVPLAICLIILIVPSFLASVNNEYYYGASKFFSEKTKLGKDTKAIEDTFGKAVSYVIMVPKGDFPKEKLLSERLHKIPEVIGITSYVDTVGDEIPEDMLDKSTLSMLISKNYSRMILTANSELEGKSAFNLVNRIRKTVNNLYSTNYVAGMTVSTDDLKTTITSDTLKINLVAIGAVFLILLFTMKSVSLPLILVVAIETAVWINLSFPYFMSHKLFYMDYLLISTIQLGSTVDYAILFTDRYVGFRHMMSKIDAIKKTITTCAVSILTSGSALVVAGFAMGFLTTHGAISGLGFLLGRGTLCSLVIVFFALPGLLYMFDGIINKTTRGVKFF